MNRTIRVRPYGGIGNRMFQYMFATALQRRVPEAIVSGTELPDWQISQSASNRAEGRRILIRKHDVPFEKLVRALKASSAIDIEIMRPSMRIGYYRHMIDDYRRMFPPGAATGAGEREIAINIRGAEILSGMHKNMMPIPISFYEHIVSTTGLEPVFVGQINDDEYSSTLRRRFPQARFVNHGFGLGDFHFVRASRNIVVATSSYSWLASWLSETAQRIVMPAVGLYHRGGRPDIDLLPHGDSRYEFFHSNLQSWRGTRDELSRLIEAPLSDFGFQPGVLSAARLGLQNNPRRFLRCLIRRHFLVFQDTGRHDSGV